ncbi:MAG: chromate transporter [Oscillospiraceae bacterium]|nr:chromate transporter [Oscillospiraceae bacterium]
MGKNLMLFIWFIKFGIITARDEYDMHDFIRDYFCPEYISAEEFDEKEQLLRDSPGPVGIKYAYYVGSKVSGIFGAVMAILALLIPVIAFSVLLFYAYGYFFSGGTAAVATNITNGIQAATLGLIAAHLFKVVYFNRAARHSWIVIVPSAFIFLFLPDIIGISSGTLMPYFIIAIIVLGLLLGFIHDRVVKYRVKHPSTKYIDPHSKKAQRIRDRKIREDEEELKKDRFDDSLKLRKEQLEEAEKKKKHRGDE